MNREPETDPRWEFLNGCDERELVDEIKLRQNEIERLRAENAELCASLDKWDKVGGTLVAQSDKLEAENAELRAWWDRLEAKLCEHQRRK